MAYSSLISKVSDDLALKTHIVQTCRREAQTSGGV